MSGVSISWHIGPDGVAAANRAVPGSIRLFDLDGPGGYPSLDIYAHNRDVAAVAASALNGEMVPALEKFIDLYDDALSNTDGEWPRADTGCFECTCGTVPDALNTGLCLYHLAKKLLEVE